MEGVLQFSYTFFNTCSLILSSTTYATRLRNDLMRPVVSGDWSFNTTGRMREVCLYKMNYYKIFVAAVSIISKMLQELSRFMVGGS